MVGFMILFIRSKLFLVNVHSKCHLSDEKSHLFRQKSQRMPNSSIILIALFFLDEFVNVLDSLVQ